MLHKKEIDNIHWVERECLLAASLTKIGEDDLPIINTLKLYDPE